MMGPNINPVIIDWEKLQEEADKYVDWGNIQADHNIVILNEYMNAGCTCDRPVWKANIKEKTLTYINTDGQAYI